MNFPQFTVSYLSLHEKIYFQNILKKIIKMRWAAFIKLSPFWVSKSVKEEGVDKTKDLKINLKIFFYF